MRIRALTRALAAAGLVAGLAISSGPVWAIALDAGKGAELEPTYVTGTERRIARLLDEHQLDKALEEVQALLKTSPNDASVLNLAGTVYFARGDHAAARKYYETALQKSPKYMSAVMNLVMVDLREGKPDEARKRLQAMITADPGNANAMVGMAGIARATHDQAGYVSWMTRAIKAAPTTAKPRALLANFYLDDMHDPGKALATAEDALNAFPTDPDVLAALGAAQLELGQSDRALATYSKLAQRARDSATAQYRLATAQVAVHDTVAARASLDRALTINPGLVEAKALRGSLDLAAGRKTQALEAARAIQKSAPLMPAGYVLEGDVLMAERQFAQAEPKYAKALELDKNDQTVIRWHKAKSQAGGAAEANARLLAWVKEQPQDYEVRTYLASVYIAEGNYPAASAQLEAVVAGQPQNYRALNDLAGLYQLQHDSRAAEIAERAYRLAPDRPEIMDTLGWILVNEGDRNRGVRLLEQAADANGAPPDARFHLALALMKSGESARARRELERLLARKDQFPQRAEAEALLRKLPN